MPETAREYLMHRFRGDATSLRDRVAALRKGTKIPGPDAAMSQRMADACDDVASMIEAIAPHDDPMAELSALVALVPLLEQRAQQHGAQPPVRAVYAGAATRIREVEQAETSSAAGSPGAASANGAGAGSAGHDGSDDHVDADVADDAEVDDDDALFGEDDEE